MVAMWLAIDVREACRPHRTGKGQWTYGFVTELLKRDLRLTLLTDAPLPSLWRERSSFQTMRFPPGFLWHLRAASWLRMHREEILYASPTSTIVPALIGKRVRCIPVVHDLIVFREEPHDRRARVIERCTLRRAVQNACHLCTVSDATKRDLLARYPFIAPENVTPIFAGPLVTAPSLGVPDGRTILCAATLCPRKNQRRLILAYASLTQELRSRYKLVLIGGRGWDDAEILQLAKSTPGVTWKGYVTDDEYAELLSTCAVFAFPSLYEGFGLPVLDALQRGIPVLTSQRGSLTEVAGDAAVFVDPEDVSSIAEGLGRLLTDAGLRSLLRQRGPIQAGQFSWERTADLFLSATIQACCSTTALASR